MDPSLRKSLEILHSYIGTTGPVTQLGAGMGGVVYLSPLGTSAIKVYHRAESFNTELHAYEILRDVGITSIMGLTVPEVIAANADLWVLEMTVVKPPFLLDFAGVRFTEPDFQDDALQGWYERIDDFFGPNAWFVYNVYNALAMHEVFYMDFKPGNIELKGLPEIVPDDRAEEC